MHDGLVLRGRAEDGSGEAVGAARSGEAGQERAEVEVRGIALADRQCGEGNNAVKVVDHKEGIVPGVDAAGGTAFEGANNGCDGDGGGDGERSEGAETGGIGAAGAFELVVFEEGGERK